MATSVGQESSIWNFSHGSGKDWAFLKAFFQLRWGWCKCFGWRVLLLSLFFLLLAESVFSKSSALLFSHCTLISSEVKTSSVNEPISSFQSCDVSSKPDSASSPLQPFSIPSAKSLSVLLQFSRPSAACEDPSCKLWGSAFPGIKTKSAVILVPVNADHCYISIFSCWIY